MPKYRLPRRLLAICLAEILLISHASAGEAYPARPVTLVVPFTAGGPTDLVGRIMAQRMSEVLGQQVIVENVGGAGGMVGSNRVARAAPDGYQVVLGVTGTHAQNQTLYKKPLYDVVTDFAPVTLIGELPFVLVVRKDLPVTTLPDFIAYARANQERMQYGSAGPGSTTHMTCVLLASAVVLNMTHVPYRGAAQAMQDLLAGRTDFQCETVATALPHIQSNGVKAIALLAPERAEVLPNVPSVREQGLPNFDATGWLAFFLPKGTPAAIVNKLSQAAADAMDSPAVQERFRSIGLVVAQPYRRGPDFLTQFVKAEVEKWAVPIRASSVSVD